tara:strand:- start:919 stop:1158 length:240 start_codon:yes stop_codon:yes gene_type:complete
MNDITILIYLICFVALFGATFAYMWRMMGSTLSEMDRTNTKNNVHPEMKNVQTGDELLVFRTGDEEEDDDGGDVVIIRK